MYLIVCKDCFKKRAKPTANDTISYLWVLYNFRTTTIIKTMMMMCSRFKQTSTMFYLPVHSVLECLCI